MEEFNASAGTQAGPGDRAASASAALDAGRIGGVLLQLQRERFEGVLNIVCDGQAASIGFREGTPVTFEDTTPGHTLADQFVERGQLTRGQCNKVLARMTDALVDDEAVAFCEHAVQLGFLTEDEAKVELSSRIRARMIQLFGWRACETSLMPGSAALLDRPEFPQSVGAILYMGVRTFYDEELLISCHPDLSQTYVRLTTAPANIVEFFGLDDEEFQLLRRIQPDDPASLLVETRKVERVHLLALLLLLRMAQFCEVFNHPQPRATSPRMPHARAPRERTQTGPLREDASAARRGGLLREEGSVSRRFDLPREDGSVARRFDLPREDGSVARRFDLPQDRAGARRPAGSSDERSASRAGPLPREHHSGDSRAGQLPRDERASGSKAERLPREEHSAGSRAGQLPRDERASGSRAERLPREEPSADSRAGKLPRDERASGSRAGQLPRDERSAGSRAGQLPRDERTSGRRAERLPREEHSTGSRAGQLPREDHSAGSRAGQLPRDEHSVGSRAERLPREEHSTGSRAGQLPRDERASASRAERLPREEHSAGSRAGQLPRDERTSGSRAERLPRDEHSAGSSAGQLPRDERASGSKAERLPREEAPSDRRSQMTTDPVEEEYSFARIAEELPGDDELFARTPRERSAARPADEPGREGRSVGRMTTSPPEPDPLHSRQPPTAATAQPAAQALQTPPPPEPQAARSPLRDPPPPGRSARPTVDATQEALLEAAARTARMRRSLPARRNSKQADALPAPAAEGGSSAKLPDPSTTYTNAYASKTGSFDPSKSGSFDPSKSGSFDPSKSGSFDPSKSGSFEPTKTGPSENRPEYAKAHLKELIARRKQTANAPEPAASSSQRDPARELREARSLLHAQHYARAEKVLSGLVELEPANELYKTYHLWARWRAQPETAETLVSEVQDLAKKLVSDGEHGGFAAYVLGHVFLHQKRDDLAEKFFKRAHAADRSNKDAERHLMILERRKQSAADGGAGANRKLFGIQLPNKPKP